MKCKNYIFNLWNQWKALENFDDYVRMSGKGILLPLIILLMNNVSNWMNKWNAQFEFVRFIKTTANFKLVKKKSFWIEISEIKNDSLQSVTPFIFLFVANYDEAQKADSYRF